MKLKNEAEGGKTEAATGKRKRATDDVVAVTAPPAKRRKGD